jgi:antitoxin (DNA-binding transcriptional repressor) of toxin-antitoxin stability system
MTERRVGTHERNYTLSADLRRVQSGEPMNVAGHGTTIGQILPVRPATAERVRAMAVSGQVECEGGKPQACWPRAINRSARQLSDLVVEDREGLSAL